MEDSANSSGLFTLQEDERATNIGVVCASLGAKEEQYYKHREKYTRRYEGI